MAITDTLNLNARQVADKNPELHQMRQKFFGQDYLSDIQKGDTGTVQYYKGLGDPNAIDYTGEQTTQPVVDASTPVVDTSGGGGGGGGDGIMSVAPNAGSGGNNALEYQGTPGGNTGSGPFDLIDNSGKDYGPYTKDLQYQGTPGGDVGSGEFDLIDSSGKDYGPYTQDAFEDPYGFEDPRALAARQGVVEPGDPYGFEDARTQQLRGVEPEQILPVAKPEAFDYSTALGDDWALGDEVQPTTPAVTEIEGQTEYRDPIMDMVAAEKPGMLGDEGFSNLDPETKENTNMIAGLWEKAKGSATNFKNMLTDSNKFSPMQILSLGNAFAGSGGALSLASGLGIPGMIIGALSKAGTQVSPEQKAANAAFEQANNINIGSDGRITDGPLAGLNPAGKSFAGSATYEEQIDNKIDSIKNRKAPQTDASRQKIADLEDMKGPGRRDKAIDEGIAAAEDDKGSDMLDILTEKEEDETDLMNFDNLGPWATDDTPIDEPTYGLKDDIGDMTNFPIDDTPTGPPANIGGDRAGPAPSAPAPTSAPSDGGFGDTSGPRGGTPSGPTGGPPGGGDPGMRSGPAPSAPSNSPGHPSNRGGGGGGGNNGCFLPDTPITMADGTEKPVKDVDIGDKVAEGGKVFATGKFLVENLYDYKGIKVSGSHMVNEEDKWTRIEDSKQGKSLGDDEHIVYVFGSENRRILIKGILFTDYFEVKEQEKFLENKEDFFKNWKKFSKEDHKSNVNILNAGQKMERKKGLSFYFRMV